MGDVLPITSLLTATPIAEPGAAPVAATLPAGDEADPFAELLAVVGAGAPISPQALVSPSAAPTAQGNVATALATSTDGDDGPTADTPRGDDSGLDDKLAATISAMLAIAPPPPPPVLAAAPVHAGSAHIAADSQSAPADAHPRAVVVLPTAASSAATAAADEKLAAQPNKVDPGEPSTGNPTKSVEARASDRAESGPDAAIGTGQIAKPDAAPTLPAAVLRMLREARASTALSTTPATPTVPAISAASTATTTPAASQGPATAPIQRTATQTQRRGDREATPRPATASAPASNARTTQSRSARDHATVERLPAEPIAVPFADLRQPAAPVDASAAPAASPVDSLVQTQLTIAQDGKWLDSLARDIAASANGSDLHFKLNPENLGSLTVSIAAQADGTAVRMTAETDRARTILTDAQPRLIAEARAQGVRISETHVELSNNSANANGGSASWGQAGGQAQPQGERRSQTSSPNHLPLEPTRSDEAFEAPARARSERYA